MSDPAHPAHRAAVEHRVRLRAQLRSLATQAGVRDPGTLADRLLLMMIDGLYANGAILGIEGAAASAVTFAEEVVAAAIPHHAPA
jgi:hypothetical protein